MDFCGRFDFDHSALYTFFSSRLQKSLRRILKIGAWMNMKPLALTARQAYSPGRYSMNPRSGSFSILILIPSSNRALTQLSFRRKPSDFLLLIKQKNPVSETLDGPTSIISTFFVIGVSTNSELRSGESCHFPFRCIQILRVFYLLTLRLWLFFYPLFFLLFISSLFP